MKWEMQLISKDKVCSTSKETVIDVMQKSMCLEVYFFIQFNSELDIDFFLSNFQTF